MKKKGVSPIIATILLIALVMIIASIIFVWFKSFRQEAITKFDGQNVQLVCGEVNFQASYSPSGTFTISNVDGNVPIRNFNVELTGPGTSDTLPISDLNLLGSDWDTQNGDKGLNIGDIASGKISISGYQKITLIPILLGLDSGGNRKTEVCDKRFSQDISI